MTQLSPGGLTATGTTPQSAIDQIIALKPVGATLASNTVSGMQAAQPAPASFSAGSTGGAAAAPQPFAPQPFAQQATPAPTPGIVMNQRAVTPNGSVNMVTDDHRTTSHGDSADVSHQNRAYNLGGNPYFVEGMSLATQSTGNRGSTQVQGQGAAAMNLGIRADMDLRQQAQNATLYGNAAAQNGTALASGLTNAGGRLDAGAATAQTRTAPLADTTLQNQSLRNTDAALQGQAATSSALGAQAGALATQGTAAGSRVAPTQNTTAQNAALGQASTALQGQTTTASQLGQQSNQLATAGTTAAYRAAPTLSTAAQNSALGQAVRASSPGQWLRTSKRRQPRTQW